MHINLQTNQSTMDSDSETESTFDESTFPPPQKNINTCILLEIHRGIDWYRFRKYQANIFGAMTS